MKKSEQVSEKIPTANRQYKDTVFRMLFSEKENLLSLYNAVTGNAYQNADDLKIVTLENAIYMGMKNDLAFMLETNIYLYEHQSTINPNIPLRDLIYIGIEYQQYLNDKSLYSSKLQKIPAPKFMVFYNGTDDVEDRMELKLSSAYEHLAGEPDLELKVLMLNVNEGHNKDLMEQCQTLKEYAIYVARVRKYASAQNLNDAVERAITECIKEGILVDFLRKNRSEVKMVSILEYDKEWEEKFKEAQEAYAVLSDAEKRKQYDQFGHAAFDGTGGGAGPRRPRPGPGSPASGRGGPPPGPAGGYSPAAAPCRRRPRS